MLAYYGYTISPNQIETGEGFLICRNVPIARTGDMKYLASELGLPGMDIVKVHRSPEEVFSDAALASFEGKPVTDDHPPELVTAETVSLYERGHAQNIRRGANEWDGYVIADLHIHDGDLVRAVQNGKRQISCGYECEYADNGDGTYSQKNIRGNHIAVVNRGRAGKRAAILDSDTINQDQARRPERKKMKKNGLLLKLFGQAAKDKSPEEIEQMAMDAADALEEGTDGRGTKHEAGNGAGNGTGEPERGAVKDAAFFDALDKKLDAILKLMDTDPEKKEKGDQDEPEEDPMDAAIKKLEDEKEDGKEPEAKVVPAEETNQKGSSMDKAVAAAILKSVRPSVAAIKDEKERKAVADALIACMTGNGDSDIAKIIQTAQKNAKKANDGRQAMDLDAIQKAYDSQNPHRKENK